MISPVDIFGKKSGNMVCLAVYDAEYHEMQNKKSDLYKQIVKKRQGRDANYSNGYVYGINFIEPEYLFSLQDFTKLFGEGHDEVYYKQIEYGSIPKRNACSMHESEIQDGEWESMFIVANNDELQEAIEHIGLNNRCFYVYGLVMRNDGLNVLYYDKLRQVEDYIRYEKYKEFYEGSNLPKETE